MNTPNKNTDVTRRDFLAKASTLSMAAIGLPKVAVAAQPKLEAAPAGAKIAKLAIYPPMGICRVGNSDKHFLAPEIPGKPSLPNGDYKDGNSKIKKQAQRFRVYAFDEKGRVIREVTHGKDKVKWSVHVASTKAAWYGFNNPLDSGELAPGLPGQKRNQFWTDAKDREDYLVIDPGEKSISGNNTNAKGEDPKHKMIGRFWKTKKVKLGELRTDEKGRLIVLPGDGESSSAIPDNPITSFSDNDAWHDDWCDGYVKAEVDLADGGSLPVEHAWVSMCGPNFAPEIDAFITLYDVITDTMIKDGIGGMKKPEGKLSFREDIYPFFQRLGQMEWVANAAGLRQGWIEVGDFTDESYIRSLADPSKENQKHRTHVFKQFRNPKSGKVEQFKIPYMLGDGVNYDDSPDHWFLIPDHQYWILKQWEEGNFVNDFDAPEVDQIESFDEIPLAQQPDALTKAALNPCSGGGFHPGVELTWPLRHGQMYSAPYRIALGNRPSLLQDIGRLLTPKKAFEGYKDTPPPIGPQMPGDLTRWMGIPWQGDAFSCQFVEFSNDFPNAVWWPALLPIDILPEAYYNQMQRKDLSPEARLRFFNSRVAWSRGVAGIGYHANASYIDGLAAMVDLWGRMGFVVSRPGLSDEGAPKKLKDKIFVEIDRGSMDLETNGQPNLGIQPK